MFRKSCFVTLIACALIITTSGCWYLAAGAAAGGTIMYVRGELRETIYAPLDEVAEATDEAIDDLELGEVRHHADGVVAHFDLKTADGQDVAIHLESTDSDATRIGIRVGVVGDRELSRRILQAIRDNL